MGYGNCTSSVTKTKTYEEKGKETVTKTVTTKCHCKEFVGNSIKACGNCWHSYDIHRIL